MPHLAPLAWAITPILFWISLFALSSSLWWSTTPSFPSCVEKHSIPSFSPWDWS